MGAENQNNQNQTRQPAQQQGDMNKQNPSQQQQQQGKMGDKSGQRIDTDGDGRTRDPNDKRPSDQGGKAPPVQR
ncbi:hypothetical protein [Phenylobacterium sp.]|jgi:hypothetical protein|uniref:hypothetical protein n=1 Tax=Phenylobacterium sp. TaxID=1871053 RepID=UPI002F40E40B